MAEVEQRLQSIEDRFALQDLVTSYCRAIDSLSDLDGLLACFTEDAVVDLTGLDLAVYRGHAAIREFFDAALNTMSHHAHYATNFTIHELADEAARCSTYIIGMGRSKDGNEVVVHARYDLDCIRMSDGWKISRFEEPVLMPLPKEVVEIHGDN